MTKIYYDLHIHSCLSPCGDVDMTPNNIVNMALLKGLQLIALTDHCSCKNCEVTEKIAKANGLKFISGMELTTGEEIHIVCLFESLEWAMKFDEYVYEKLMPIKNKPHIFGEQSICNEDDEIIGCCEKLLINATSISVSEVPRLMEKFHGIAFPAHIEKSANSILAMLGFLPAEYGFNTVEVKDPTKLLSYPCGKEILENKRILKNSDAHYLADISEAENALEISSPDYFGIKKIIADGATS